MVGRQNKKRTKGNAILEGGVLMGKKILLLLVALLSITGLITACHQNGDVTMKSQKIEFEIVDPSSLQDEVLRQWYEQFYRQKGAHSANGAGGYKYVLISAGEKPTGGYGVEITGVEKEEGVIYIAAKVVSPKIGDMVIQALTYPHVLVRFRAEETEEVRVQIKE